MNGQESDSFKILDERVQNWVWRHEWNEFRGVQENAIPIILKQQDDVILAASTSSGKTEAAFLPIVTKMLQRAEGFGLTVYISPLIALINDQLLRAKELCEGFEIPVYPWHGGIGQGLKKKFFAKPQGLLLITPESLQALLCNHGFEFGKLFKDTQYIVIDELHSFIGSERGKQLQSLLHLIDVRISQACGNGLAAKKNVVRIGLSATLGDMQCASDFLTCNNPNSEKENRRCIIIQDKTEKTKIKLLLKGITEDKTIEASEADSKTENLDQLTQNTFSAPHAIADYLYAKLRGTNNLIFPNSRSKVEFYSHLLSALCEINGVPNEFFAHHGNLSKEIREEAEDALRSTEHSANLICTNTMEMGIDIGQIASVVQIEAPPSVASLRQRVGRSGRRYGEVSVLRAFAIEEKLSGRSHLFTQLRESTFQFCASIMLLLEGWCEPLNPHGMHLSTLIQQILALIAECGGIKSSIAYNTLCENGPFTEVDNEDFNDLVKALEKSDIIEKEGNILLLGTKGEKIVNRYTFYAAFAQDMEYRIVNESKTLGTLPVNSSLQAGDFIIFAGRTWKIQKIDDRTNTIDVKFFASGRPPVFTGNGFCLHTNIRRKMKALYESTEDIPFADKNAKLLIAQGRESYRRYKLSDQNYMLVRGTDTVLFTWLGDKANRTLHLLIKHLRISSFAGGIALIVHHKDIEEVKEILRHLKKNEFPKTKELLQFSQNLFVEKWDKLLPANLVIKNYESLYLSFSEVREWLNKINI
ncbi:MAG: DEAD/DEAH box helicase [Termitinemataceae bacterium]|nr:MAG: DEAD/DEAH box helicase [Termitinemataceae bacterium]